MRIDVLVFGSLQDLFGGDSVRLELPEGSCVRELVDALRAGHESPIWSTVAVAVNREYASLTTTLTDGDEVALLPPVSGGADAR